jgi:7-cyano-7-deazaguanine reductase
MLSRWIAPRKHTPEKMPTSPSKTLQTFANPSPQRNYEIRFDCPEFTCLCPLTGQPDFARIRVTYIPDQLCVELKSLKLYLWSFRDEGAFHEAVTNRILDDLVAVLSPRHAVVIGEFWVRGGIATTVEVRHPNPSLPADQASPPDAAPIAR